MTVRSDLRDGVGEPFVEAATALRPANCPRLDAAKCVGWFKARVFPLALPVVPLDVHALRHAIDLGNDDYRR